MARLRIPRVLYIAALLCVGHAPATHASAGAPAEQAELVASAGDVTGAALPAQVNSAVGLFALDLRSVPPLPRVQRSRDRVCGQHGIRSSQGSTAREPATGRVAARLLRGGIDSSSLGTPPPQS